MLTLKPIRALLTDDQGQPAVYRIAAYQRGYRWSPVQVTQLLDDLWEVINENGRDPDAFYCLQPLVIKPGQGCFEVVDGQQRLTTILLILNYFNLRLVEEDRQELYSIVFETRAGFDQFLAKPSEELAMKNVDFFHLYRAMQGIKEWFAARPTFRRDIETALLNRTQVVWFQLADDDHPVDAFTRLNAGKIPLTDDELIRALFLRRGRPGHAEADAMQRRIAGEWDLIEKTLQDEAFWYFLSNKPGPAQNRIGYLFKLLAHSERASTTADGQTVYAIFDVFNRRLKAGGTRLVEGEKLGAEWLKVKEAFMRLEEWFQDRSLYHIVGFLVNEAARRKIDEVEILDGLRQLAQEGTKSEFDARLRRRVFTQLIGPAAPDHISGEEIHARVQARLESLEYGSDNEGIRSLLLLFNVATLLQDGRSNMRFRFDSFKSASWNIEHVRSIASEPPETPAQRRVWLELCLGYFQANEGQPDLRAEIQAFLGLPARLIKEETFNPLYWKVLRCFQEEKEGDVHGVANLVLLDEETNKSYKNAPFAVKRQRILKLDQAGIFVPLCTRNVFLKCYSPQVDDALLWGVRDQTGYRETMVKTLVSFFTGQQEGSK